MSKSTIELAQMPAVPSSPDSGKPAVVGSASRQTIKFWADL